MKAISALLVFCLLAAGAAIAKDKKRKGKEGGIRVRLGKTIKRDYRQVVKDQWAYGPKQEYDNETKLTHIWLPYGDDEELYAHTKGIFRNPSLENGMATFHSYDSSSDAALTYRIEFSHSIGEFTFKYGKFEYGLEKGTVAGIEYSTDGKRWITIKEVEGTKPNDVQTISSFIPEFKTDKIRTRELYIRFYSRSREEPGKIWGSGRWLQLWLGGDPNWGDVSRTFFIHQPQIWVKKHY